ncbi:neprilysin-4 [Drosophila sulfurigaster albostrigata]|uniref:neprilysin-4 n=1 Tax=Drosophila sulfurigaster albostrigata TaxID=89887 RepID=UPI002D21EA5B|nr:neprilysin-4 [Drosophila sulfurigaster albostrigata]
MSKMRWQWQLPMLCLLIIKPRSLCSEETAESGRFFTEIYKRNLKQIVELRNATIEPCDDFYAHACGNFGHLAAAEEPEDALPPMLYNKQDRMEFFMAQHVNFKTLPGKALSQLYTQCKQRREQHVFRPAPRISHWQRLVHQLPMMAPYEEALSFWPFLPYQWQQLRLDEQLNWVELSAQLAAHGVPTLLHIYFAQETIYVASISNLPCPSLQGFRRSLASVLHGSHPQVSRIVAHEMRVLCRGMRGELPTTTTTESATESQGGGQEQLTLDGNTMDYFQHFFAQLNFTDEMLSEARKLPLDVARIRQAWQVLRYTDPRIIVNYVLWQVQQELRYEDCYVLAQEFERLLHVEYWQWHVFRSQLNRNVAFAMYQLHTTRFQQLRRSKLSRRDWYGYMLPEEVERKELQVARLLQTHAQHYLNLIEHELHYGALELQPRSFYSNLLLLRRAQLRHSFVSPFVDPEDVQQPAYFLRHFLHFVQLVLQRPMYHYYATQGLQLWRQSRLLEDTDGYYTALDCLQRQTEQHYDLELQDIYRPLASHEVDDVFKFYRSFQAALRDYHFWLEGERFHFAEQFVLQFFGLDEHRVLFYAVAQQMCNRQDEIFAAQLNRGYMNLPEFQAAFNCSADAAMNPAAKCMINQCEK